MLNYPPKTCLLCKHRHPLDAISGSRGVAFYYLKCGCGCKDVISDNLKLLEYKYERFNKGS
jgi:hypothetical protein